MTSKLYYCVVFDTATNSNLCRKALGDDLVRLCSTDFPRLISAGFRILVFEYDNYSEFGFTLDVERATYRANYRRAVRNANFILIHRKLPPKL